MENKFVESVAASLVREYLSRKGLKDTLTTMDDELPRDPASISNRQELMKALHIERMVKKNKELDIPHKSMIEMMTRQFLEKKASTGRSSGGVGDVTGRRSSSTSEDPLARPASVAPLYGNAFSTDGPDADDVFTSGSKYLRQKQQTTDKVKRNGDLVIEDEIESETVLGDGKAGLLELQDPEEDMMNPGASRAASKGGKIRGMSGPISSNLDDRDRKRRPRSSRPASGVKSEVQNDPGNLLNDTPYTTANTLSTSASPTNYSGVTKYSTGSSSVLRKAEVDALPSSSRGVRSAVPTARSASSRKWDKEPEVDFVAARSDVTSTTAAAAPVAAPRTKRPLTSRLSGVDRRRFAEEENEEEEAHSTDPYVAPDKLTSPSSPARKNNLSASAMTKVGDVEIGDVDDLDADLAELEISSRCMPAPTKPPNMITDSKPIDVQTAVELKVLIFGSPSLSFNDEWRYQSFAFNDAPKLQYGIVQKKGGPCGVLAAVQACVLKHFLFMKDSKPTANTLSSVKKEDRSEALAQALCEILWRAGDNKYAVVALPSGRSILSGSGRYKPDGLTETLVLNYFKKFEDLQSFMKQSVSQFEMENFSGVILILYSAIFSRTISEVKSDMDEEGGKLMGAHGYCTQEMVNLLVSGRAVSNVFNDTVTLDAPPGEKSTVLRGVNKRCDVGLMSLFEHYKSCQVGTYLKTPRYPIWVVCSESHFSVLFCLKRELLSDWKAEKRFDLYYYDGLARQEDEIKLSIDTTNRYFTPPSDDDLVPPIDHCIRTKWPDAEVDWNGTEPLL